MRTLAYKTISLSCVHRSRNLRYHHAIKAPTLELRHSIPFLPEVVTGHLTPTNRKQRKLDVEADERRSQKIKKELKKQQKMEKKVQGSEASSG